MNSKMSLGTAMLVVGAINYLLITLGEAAPTLAIHDTVVASHIKPASTIKSHEAPVKHERSVEISSSVDSAKLNPDFKARLASVELDTQETGYLPSAYPSATESDYGYDSGKNTYGKQASDWSLYDQGKFNVERLNIIFHDVDCN